MIISWWYQHVGSQIRCFFYRRIVLKRCSSLSDGRHFCLFWDLHTGLILGSYNSGKIQVFSHIFNVIFEVKNVTDPTFIGDVVSNSFEVADSSYWRRGTTTAESVRTRWLKVGWFCRVDYRIREERLAEQAIYTDIGISRCVGDADSCRKLELVYKVFVAKMAGAKPSTRKTSIGYGFAWNDVWYRNELWSSRLPKRLILVKGITPFKGIRLW